MSDLCLYTVDQRLTILRYLRANNFDVKKTITHIKNNIQYRKDKNVRELVNMNPEDILGFPMEKLMETLPHWHISYSKFGNPVICKQYTNFNGSKLKKLCGGNFDKAILYHIWEQEASAKLCYERTLKYGKLIETIDVIIDMDNMLLFQLTPDFLYILHTLAIVDQQQYPETLNKMFIINTPSTFPMVWSGIKYWIDPITTMKMFISSSPNEYDHILELNIGKENLPQNYNGELPYLSHLIHPYIENMAFYEKNI